jgi:hypothetical protein
MPNSTKHNAKKSWRAMIKFASNEPLTPAEWSALSWLTLIDRSHLEFGPKNTRWAASEVERESNLKFFRSLGVH